MLAGGFTFHDVCDDVRESGFQRQYAASYKHSRRVFEQRLDQIAASPFTVKAVSELDFTQPGKHILLTFDDGGRSAVYISDKLSSRGWKGHFFIVTSLIGSRAFLSEREIRYIHSCGHIIGSHSHTHPDIFKALRKDEMIREWRISCDRLSTILGKPCEIASVPGGDISDGVLEVAHESGLRYLFTSEPVLIAERRGECWILGRACLKADTPAGRVHQLAQLKGWRREMVIRRMKVFTRTLFPPLYRRYVQHMIRDPLPEGPVTPSKRPVGS